MPKTAQTFQAPKGFHDILPQDQKYWERLRKVVKTLAAEYGFKRIDPPIAEDSGLFLKTLGLTSDVVEKQTFTFKTKGGDSLTLRPEGTAGVMRAYIEHGLSVLPQPLKLYYFGPMFRYEQPQAGRYRQFYQFGFEVIGEADPVIDAQLLKVFYGVYSELGIKGLTAQINSIGCKVCRPQYRSLLKDYYRNKVGKLCADCRRRFKENPLRLLDCKDEKCQLFKNQAPHAVDHLCQECHDHFKSVLEFLDELELPYALNPFLVRGLDYYTKTVFEIWSDSAQTQAAALGAGGRFDDFIEVLGGKSTPAVGAAGGAERTINLMKAQEIKVPSAGVRPKVFLIQLGDAAKKKSLVLFEEFRKAGLAPAEAFSKQSIKAQLRIADKMGAQISLILGQKEVMDGNIILREMTSGVQEIIPLEKILSEVKKRLKK